MGWYTAWWREQPGASRADRSAAVMELRQNERGAWYSHYLEDEGRYCKGVTK